MGVLHSVIHFFFFNDTATTEIYTLSLHDALPISTRAALDKAGAREQSTVSTHATNKARQRCLASMRQFMPPGYCAPVRGDRKSTRLNSSHSQISYAVFCLKKKKNKKITFTVIEWH